MAVNIKEVELYVRLRKAFMMTREGFARQMNIPLHTAYKIEQRKQNVPKNVVELLKLEDNKIIGRLIDGHETKIKMYKKELKDLKARLWTV